MQSTASRRVRVLVLTPAVLSALCGSVASAGPWPIDDVNKGHPILSSYGQFYEDAGGLHFHEGLDILRPDAKTEVKAIGAGKIVKVEIPADSYYSFIVVENSADLGWNYIHMAVGTNPKTKAQWKAGDDVVIGDVLGTIQDGKTGKFNGKNYTLPSHLHLDWGGKTDPSDWYGKNQKLRNPSDEPRRHFDVLDDSIAPTVGKELMFRIKDHDRNGTIDATGEVERKDNLYFREKVRGSVVMGARAGTSDSQGNKGAGSAGIDIVQAAYDETTKGGYRTGIHSTWFRIDGKVGGGSSGWVNPFRFGGQFLDGHGYDKMRDAALVRAVYSNDADTDSEDGFFDGTTRQYWHTLTNKNDNEIVEDVDRGRYWKSNVEKGAAWNATAKADAKNNANAAFPDDFYTIQTQTFDVGLNLTMMEQTILLDNFEQKIAMSADFYLPNEDAWVASGQEFLGERVLPLMVLASMPQDGDILPGMKAFTVTDADGVPAPQTVGDYDPGQYWVVADYDSDGVFTDRLDAATTFTVVPGPGTVALLCLSGLVSIRRRTGN